MNNQTLEKILIGSAVALVAAIINQLFAGNINYWWVLIVFIGAIIFIWAYQRYGGSLFTKYRVDKVNEENGKRLLARRDILDGEMVGEAWQFKAQKDDWAIYGPYLREPLRKGKYRATFRVKINDTSTQDIPVIELSVASNCGWRGGKQLASRTFSTRDFKKTDEYHDFSLDFYTFADERELEFRVWSKGTQHTVTLDYVELSRRLV